MYICVWLSSSLNCMHAEANNMRFGSSEKGNVDPLEMQIQL